MSIIAVIEIPAGSHFKYEVDKASGVLLLDRPLNQPIPNNYGFFPQTLCDDSDPLDLFCLTYLPIVPLARVKVEIVGVIKCLDGGVRDDKIIAILVGDCHGYERMGTAVINRYLETYKEGFQIIGAGGKEEAENIYAESVKMYKNSVLDQLARVTEDLVNCSKAKW